MTMSAEGHFRTRDGEQLFTRCWRASESRGSVALIHGYGEHSGRYDHVAAAFNALDLDVYTYDQRGHGRSPGKRGHMASYRQLVLDLQEFLQHLAPKIGEAPTFFFAHSMGGLVLVNYLADYRPPVRGIVFSSPFLCLGEEVSPMLVRISRVLEVVAPWAPVARVNPEYVSRDAAVVQTYIADPFVFHGKINAKTGAQINAAVERAQQNLDRINAPAYILHGTADRLAPPASSTLLHEGIGSSDRTLRLYDGGYHELFNDQDRQQVLDEIGEWLRQKLGEDV